MIFDRNGNPITIEQWVWLRSASDEYCRVALDEVGDQTVSTAWLGVDHNWCEGEPHIFETMLFNSEGSGMLIERYSTEAQAQEGHKAAVAALLARKEGLRRG